MKKIKVTFDEQDIKELIAEAIPNASAEDVTLRFSEQRDWSDRLVLGHTVSAEVTLK